MTDDDAREIVRATLAHHVHGTRHGYTHADVRQALERALEWAAELDSDQYAPGPRLEPDDSAPFRATTIGDTLAVEMVYPKQRGGRYVEISQESVRASDGIRVSYDYDRDGFVVEQPVSLDADPIEWREAAFLQSWALEAGGGDPEPTTAELRAEAERLAREVYGDEARVSRGRKWDGHYAVAQVRPVDRLTGWKMPTLQECGVEGATDEHTALRALVAALREIRRGDGPA